MSKISGESVKSLSGNLIPSVGLGTWQIDDEAQIETAVRAAIDAGYRHIDTAYVYFNENFIGNTLKKIFEEGKVKRSDLFITSKLPLNGHRHVEYFCKKSMQALQVDYLDMYLIHSPLSCKKNDNDDDFMPMVDSKLQIDGSVVLTDTWKSMEGLVDKGLVRCIGISNFNMKQIKNIIENCRIKPDNLQVECHAFFPQNKLHDFCKTHNITFTAYAPIGSPGMADFCKRRYNIDFEVPNLLDNPLLLEIAAKHKKTTAQVLLRSLIQRGIIVVPKSCNPKRIAENIEIFDFNLDEEDIKKTNSLDKGERIFKFDKPDGVEEHPHHPFHDPY